MEKTFYQIYKATHGKNKEREREREREKKEAFCVVRRLQPNEIEIHDKILVPCTGSFQGTFVSLSIIHAHGHN